MPATPAVIPAPVEDAPPAVLRGIIRTTVPYVIGLLVTWLGSKGIDLPEDVQAQLAAGITVLVGTVYYAAVRELEKVNPALGWLIGSPHAPVYPSAIATTGAETPNPDAPIVVRGPANLGESIRLVPEDSPPVVDVVDPTPGEPGPEA